jgi:TP901 family phage tail tape measure protein
MGVGYTGNIAITSTDGTGPALTSATARVKALEAQVAATQGQLANMGKGAAAPGFANSIRKHQLALRMFGHDAQMVGQTIFRWVTLPLGVVSVVTAKMAYDFNTAMTKVQALTGTSTEMMGEYNTAVLELSKSTGVMPTEVAEGLYFIASSGFKGASALKILTQSTRLAATGMGDMMFMGQTLTSAMTAWGEKTLSAAEAADTLVAAVREGKAEPDEFSRSLGRVIPVASQVGIKFQEVAAAIASMTNIGMSARISTFALRTLLTSFLKPQKPLIEGLKEVGLTVPKVVKQMTTEGFLPAMETIYKATHGSATKITRMFTQNAGTAFLALFRSADKTRGIFRRTLASEGDALRAFATAMESPAAKFRVALANLSAAAIVLGNQLLPIFTKIVTWVSGLVSWFNGLAKSTQAWIGKLLVALAVTGLLLTIVGKLSTVLTSAAAMTLMFGGAEQVGIFGRFKAAGIARQTAALEAQAAALAEDLVAAEADLAAQLELAASMEAAAAATTSETVALKANAAANAEAATSATSAASANAATATAATNAAVANTAFADSAIVTSGSVAASVGGISAGAVAMDAYAASAYGAALANNAFIASWARGAIGESTSAARLMMEWWALATPLPIPRRMLGAGPAARQAIAAAPTQRLLSAGRTVQAISAAPERKLLVAGEVAAIASANRTSSALSSIWSATSKKLGSLVTPIVGMTAGLDATAVSASSATPALLGVGAAATSIAGPIALIAGVFGGLGAALIVLAKKDLDPTGENWRKSTKALAEFLHLEKTVQKRTVEIKTKIVLDDETKSSRILRREGTILLTVNDVKAWGAVNRLRDYIQNPGRWVMTISAHETAKEAWAKAYKDFKAQPQHKIQLPAGIDHENFLRSIQVINMTQKIKPIKVPFDIDLASDKKIKAWYNTLSKPQQVQYTMQVNADKATKALQTVTRLGKQIAHLKTLKATPEIKARIADLEAKYKTAMRRLKTLTGTTATPKVHVDNTQANSAINDTINLLSQVQSKTVVLTIQKNIQDLGAPMPAHGKGRWVNGVWVPQAFGGLYNLRSATRFIAGEAGPEVAAFFPMNNPTRSADLLAQLNAQMGGSNRPSGSVSSSSTYHIGVTLPGGLVVSDIDKFGRTLSPHIDRTVQMAERRRQRGVAGL